MFRVQNDIGWFMISKSLKNMIYYYHNFENYAILGFSLGKFILI